MKRTTSQQSASYETAADTPGSLRRQAQQQVAELADVAYATVGKIERGGTRGVHKHDRVRRQNAATPGSVSTICQAAQAIMRRGVHDLRMRPD